MTGIYSRGGDLARDVVEYGQARPALLAEADALLDDIRRLPTDTAADVLLVWLETAGSYGRIAESRAERARQAEAQDARARRAGLTGGVR